jgi:hypothetical protein
MVEPIQNGEKNNVVREKIVRKKNCQEKKLSGKNSCQGKLKTEKLKKIIVTFDGGFAF